MNHNAASVENRRTALAAAGLVMALTAALTGCQSAVNAPPESAAAVEGGTLVVAQNADAQPANVLAGRAGNYPWVRNVFEPLTQNDPDTGEPVGILATKWTVAEDGLAMDIELRDDVTFHTGRPMTAEDVKFTFEQAADPVNASQVGFIGRQFTGIEVTGDHSLTITFESPLSNVFDFFDQSVIIDSETFAGLADGSQVVGTGPFTWVNWEPGAELTLEKYEDYRDADDVNLDGIEFAVITDGTAQISALRSGRAAIGYGMSTTDALGFEGNDQFTLVNTGGTIYPLGLNTTIAPFDDPAVRQAVGYAIDRSRINEQVFGGQATETDLFWSPSEPGYSDELAGRYTYDPEKATQMIADAGAVGAEVPIVVPAIPAVQSIFEIVRNNLEAVGLKASAVSLSVTDFDARQVAGDLGPAFLLLHGQVGYGAGTLISSLPSLREGNPSQFFPAEYVTLRQDLLAAVDSDSRSAALEGLSEYMLDAAFSHPIVQAPGTIVLSTKVQGVEMSSRGAILAMNASLTE